MFVDLFVRAMTIPNGGEEERRRGRTGKIVKHQLYRALA
jgi:hypothetical protein